MLLQDWATEDPTPPDYNHLPSLTPHLFMGPGKFVVGRIHQMRSAKSYLAAHPSWFDQDPDLNSPRCGTKPETFRHAILTCHARTGDGDPLLKEVSSLEDHTALWSDPHLIRALGEYITHTKTGFPPDMILELFFAPSPSPPPFQS